MPVKDEVKNVNSLEAKKWRSAKVTIKINKSKTSDTNNLGTQNNGEIIYTKEYANLSSELQEKYDINEYILKEKEEPSVVVKKDDPIPVLTDYFYDIFIHKVGADSTGYFDTGVQVNTEYTFEVTCKVEPGLMGNIIWGGTGGSFRTGFHIFTSSNKIQYYWGNINNTSPTLSTTSSIDFTKEFTVKQNKSGITISQEGKDDVNYTYNYTGEQTTAENNIELLHYPAALNANIKYGALKRVKIWDENNELIRDFRTVKRTVDGVVYLHDEVYDLVYFPVVTDDTDGGLEEYV